MKFRKIKPSVPLGFDCQNGHLTTDTRDDTTHGKTYLWFGVKDSMVVPFPGMKLSSGDEEKQSELFC